MFPASPRSQNTAKVIPLGNVSDIALKGGDPDFIIFEVFNTTFSTSKVRLPLNAPIGKVFRFALVTSPATNPTLTTHYIDIIVPHYKASAGAATGTWRLYSGQRPEFYFGPNGWVTPAGGALTNVGANVRPDLAIGNTANGSESGVAIGDSASAYTAGVVVGNSASAFSSGVAIGFQANGATNGVAVGYNTAGTSSGVAVGYSATGSTNGVAVGFTALSNSKDMAVALGYRSKAERYRELVKTADGVTLPLRVWAMVDWYGDTTDATATELLLGGTASQRCVLLNNSAFMFSMQIIAAVTAGGDTASWTIVGAIKRGANAAATALVGVPAVVSTGQDAGAAAWAVAVTADTTNGALKFTVTGAAATTIRWNATATLSEARF